MVVKILHLESAQLAPAKTSIEGEEEHDVQAALGVFSGVQTIEEGFHALDCGNVQALSRHGTLDVFHGRVFEDSLFHQEGAEDLQNLYPGEP